MSVLTTIKQGQSRGDKIRRTTLLTAAALIPVTLIFLAIFPVSPAVETNRLAPTIVIPNVPGGIGEGARLTSEDAVPDPRAAVVRPRGVGAIGALILAATLLLLYAYRRRSYILYWSLGWAFSAAFLGLMSRGYATGGQARAAVALAHLFTLGTAALFLLGADRLRGRNAVKRRHVGGAFLILLAWYIVGPPLVGIQSGLLLPGYVLATGMASVNAFLFYRVFREQRMLGAAVAALTQVGLAALSVNFLLEISRLTSSSEYALQMFFISVLLHTFLALGMHLVVFEDMTLELRKANRSLEEAQEELLRLAITDPLTGCHNRRFLDQVVEHELERHRRYQIPMSLLFADVDRFKGINDTYGHDAGDRVLEYVAQFLRRHVREADYVFRWGGDEFLVMLSCTEREAQQKARLLKNRFGGDPEAAELPPGVTLSVGCVEVPPDTVDLAPFVREADLRMYKDKASL